MGRGSHQVEIEHLFELLCRPLLCLVRRPSPHSVHMGRLH